MKHLLLAPAPQRRGRMALTLVASLVFHGSLVGVAALWPYHTAKKAVPLPPIIGVDGDPFPLPPIDQTPDPSTPGPVKYDPPQAEPIPPLPDNDTPPPMTSEDMLDPMPATPPPRTAIATQPRTSRVPEHNGARGPVASVGHPGAPGTSSGAVPGPVHPGVARWNVSSKPAYPMTLKAARIQGSGTIHVTTDGSGHVVEASMSQSTGNSALDSNTCRHARAFWTGPANTSIDVPITYRLN